MDEERKWWQTKAFWALIIDGVINLIVLIAVEFATPEQAEFVRSILLAIQAIILPIIAGAFGSHVEQAIRRATAQGALDAAYTMQQMIDEQKS